MAVANDRTADVAVAEISAELERAEAGASVELGRVRRRSLGPVSAADVVAFARACGESDPRMLDARRPDFFPHPMYVVSLLRGDMGAEDAEFREDGMYVDEVPGTEGLDVVLMAGGQDVTWHCALPLEQPIEMTRRLVSVRRKGQVDAAFLLLTVEKHYTASGRLVAAVTERFIVR